MYYCFLGHQPELSILELETLVGAKPTLVTPEIVSLDEGSNLLSVADKLGGTAKIAQLLITVPPDQVIPELTKLITTSPVKNIALSNYTLVKVTPDIVRGIKDEVTATRPIRFVSFEDRGHELLMIAKQHVAEYNLIPQDGQVVITETVWIYDSLGFAARDRKKPYQDIKRGMLPVKLARIMVNLAVRGVEGQTLLDPFCGTGTILSEALMIGCHIVGSDLDHLAVSGAETNLSWHASRYNLKSVIYKLFVSDATHIGEHVASVDAVVTEPLMGPLLDARRPLPEVKIRNIARGLDKLYRGAFKSWLPLLQSGGRVVITLPVFEIGKLTIPTISIDTIESLGYNYVLSVPYSKPGSTVIRNITILEKK